MSAGPGEARLLAALAQSFPSLPVAGPIGIAVSGGGDSLALLHLAERAFAGHIEAVTVDHGLRPESAVEARGVADFCATRSIPHTTLLWRGPSATGNLMDQARLARRALIAAWAAGQGIADVLLGLTADDQAETLLMNMSRGSGLDGLSGLRPSWRDGALTWHRPFLQISRAELRDYLRAEGIAWVDDPSNDNDRFARARARKLLKALAPLGLTADRLAQTARNLAAARAGLQEVTAEAAATLIDEKAGALTLDGAALERLPEEIQRRLLIAALRWIASSPHPPREAKLDQLRLRLAQRRDATLGGVRFRWSAGRLLIAREMRASGGPVGPDQVWDGRWRLEGPARGDTEIRAVGPDGLRLCPGWRAYGPRAALIVTPALWQGERLISAPLAGFAGDFRAQLTQGFANFVLSH